VRPHGVRGEVAAEILTDFPERLTRLSSVELWDGRGVPRRAAVRKCWLSHSRGGQAIFHFAESDSVDDARKLVGLEVQVPLADRVKLPAGSYYISDLVGCAVREKDGSDVGLVRGGARRWVRLGPVLAEPSELVKLGLVFFLADFHPSQFLFQSRHQHIFPLHILKRLFALVGFNQVSVFPEQRILEAH